MSGRENFRGFLDIPMDSAPKRRRNAFSSEEKRILSQKVKSFRCIWDITSPSHNNLIEVPLAWRKIAHAMDKSVMECKTAWKSLKDSRRYHLNIAKKLRESGDAGSSMERDPLLQNVGVWEFAKELNFLPALQEKQILLKPAFSEVNDSCVSTDTESYNHTTRNSYSDDQTQKMQETSQEAMSNLSKYLDVQIRATPQKNYDKYAYMDHLLKKLPEEVADDLMFDFICMIRQEIKRLNSEI